MTLVEQVEKSYSVNVLNNKKNNQYILSQVTTFLIRRSGHLVPSHVIFYKVWAVGLGEDCFFYTVGIFLLLLYYKPLYL